MMKLRIDCDGENSF